MSRIGRLISACDIDGMNDAKDILEALNDPEINMLRNKKILKTAEENFNNLKSYIYYVKTPSAKKRRAYVEEINKPNEFLFAESSLHTTEEVYKNYALVLWVITGYASYARVAGWKVKYARVMKKTISNAISVMVENKGELFKALDWWKSEQRRNDIANAVAISKKTTLACSYISKAKKPAIEPILPYIDWQTAANAVMGMLSASQESCINAWVLKRGGKLRPDQKAQFIRDYIVVEQRTENAADDKSTRELKELCEKMEKFVELYPIFNDDKIKDILLYIRRSGYMRASFRQAEYLKRTLQNAEALHELTIKEKVGADILDIDAFFDL